jgi:polygalacturonase/lysophospholipase L1-like esterase
MQSSRLKTIFVWGAVLATLWQVHAAEFRVADYGARPGDSTNTTSIQRAIDAAASAGGGAVTFAPGTYRSGALFLKSNVRMDLPEGTVLQAIQDDSLYPDRPTRVAGIEMVWPTALLNVYQQTNVSITGKGTIDGNGEYWWHKFWGKDGKGGMLKDYQARGLRWAVDYDCKRVRALAVYDSSDVNVEGITILRSGFWSLTLTYCHDVTVDGVIIRANINGFGPSSDGIDIDSCRKVLVQNCDIDCNDDNICLKAGRDWDGLRVNRRTEDIIIRDCITRSGHGMLTLGSETSGGIRNVEVSGLKAFGTSNGVRFKSARVRGGVIENIVLRDITMESVENPFHFELNWYPAYSYPTIPPEIDRATMPAHWSTLTHPVEPPELGIPEFKNIVISNVTATGAEQAIYANAFPEKPLRQMQWKDVRIEAREPGRISNAADWSMKDVVISTPSKNKLKVTESTRIESPQIVFKTMASLTHKPGAASPFMLGLGNTADDALNGTTHRFDFTRTPMREGWTQVSASTLFSPAVGYGFEPAPAGSDNNSTSPREFSVALPEGNYDVRIVFGDAQRASTNTIKAESRRLMLERVITRPGQFLTNTLTVNTRTPAIPGGDRVHLKDREHGVLHWDDKLTIEFNGTHPAVRSLEITPATNTITVYLLGDSTVTDQPGEPWNSWGQMLTRFFQPGVAVANHAESGESLKNSLRAKRVKKVFSSIKPGDYLFVQYGHNDMKDKATNALTTYRTNLLQLVADTRARGATPVLITSMERMAGVSKNTLADFPQTVRDVAKEENVALIDLNAMSRTLYQALGSNLKAAFQDGTHHNAYGSYELARCVVLGIQQSELPLAQRLVPDAGKFNPGQPDSLASFAIPPSAQRSTAKPDGS